MSFTTGRGDSIRMPRTHQNVDRITTIRNRLANKVARRQLQTDPGLRDQMMEGMLAERTATTQMVGLLRSHYTLDYMSFLGLRIIPEKYRAFARKVERANGNHIIATDESADECFNQMLRMSSNTFLKTCGFFLLRFKGEIVSVATLVKGNKVNTITTFPEHRGKGYGTMLMTLIREYAEMRGGRLFSPVREDVAPLVQRAGWVCRPTDETTPRNRDGTIDYMVPHALPYYPHFYTAEDEDNILDWLNHLQLLSVSSSF
jgi:ribosomal protein S18 acetylase RimI-like enzyme